MTPDGWYRAHPFSLSAAPTDSHLRLTVKALGDGSADLQDVEVGMWVVAEGPYGAVTAARRTQRDVLLMAVGVGITPMRALFETLPPEPGQDLTLLYRARSAEDVVFSAELDEIARRRGARVVYVLGDQPDGLTAESLLRLVPGLPERDVFLCAPPGMSAVVRRALDQAGLAHQQLHEERFVF